MLEPEKQETLYKRQIKVAKNRIGATSIMWFVLLLAFLLDIFQINTFVYCTVCIALLILYNFPALLILKHVKNRRIFEIFSLLINALEIIGYTAIIYFMGGIMAAFLMLIYFDVIAYAGMLAPNKTPYFMATVSTLSFTTMVLLVHFGIIPHQKVIFPEVVYDLKTQLMITLACSTLIFIIAFISSQTSIIINRNRRELAELVDRYREHVENIGDIVYILDGGRRIKYVNKSFERLIGIDFNSLNGKRFREIAPFKSRNVINNVIKDQKRGEEIGLFELEFEDARGVKRMLEMREHLILERGAVKEIHGMGRDVTERKALEEQLLRSQRMEAISTLIGGIAHDFNNILATILGYASFLKNKSEKGSLFYDGLDAVEKSASRASDLTSQLLAYTRRGKFEIKPINMNWVVKEVYDLISRTFDKSIKITVETDKENLKTVEGDKSQLSQVVMNIAVNAQNAMPKGGKFSIRTYMRELKEEMPKGNFSIKPGEYVCIDFKDTGIGMSEDDLSRIFEPYFTTRGDKGGTGLGMSVVYGIVKGHGGYIEVESSPGEGSGITVYFPASRKDEAPLKAVSAQAVGGTDTILIIDDEKIILKMTKDILEESGYKVYTADSGKAGIKKFVENEIDLVILDIKMPDMGGKEVLERILQIDWEARVLLSSGYSEEDQHHDLLKIGAKNFIGKPFVSDRLLLEIRKVLD